MDARHVGDGHGTGGEWHAVRGRKPAKNLATLKMAGMLARLPVVRSIVPRVTPPLLPTSHRVRPTRLFRNFPARLRPLTTRSPSPDPPHTLPPDASLSQRLKHLIKSYGWYALGVYAVLTVLDFGVAFAGVNLLGAEYVSRVAASVKGSIYQIFHSKPPEPGRDEIDPSYPPPGHAAGGNEGLYAMLVLAYTIHKTLFLPVRVGLTAALTPRIVSWLSRRGWAGSAGTRRAAQEMRERLRDRSSRNAD
ncbi:hypothetical protein BDN72DRAFT_509502 [Pluteus cervinus]|uniref:Uncharacterized protein n=1 Tax=Pluteus cervinus TaxID=181527 RepID=A0ACD3BE52_9AGAR|nr:hypothetical protein BDN72DRAFT_509502 [Pluteus cervinus]